MARFAQISFGNLGWRGKIGLVVATALGLAAVVVLILLSLGLAFILIPVVAVALLIGRWRLRKMTADMEAARPPGPRTIEIDYEVIDKPGRDRQR